MLSPFLQKLLFVNQFGIDKGEINMLGDKLIMLHASAILELQDIDESKLYDIAKKSSLKNLVAFVEHAKVYGKIKNVVIKELIELGQKIGQTDAGTIKTLEDLFNINGLGKMNIKSLDNANKEVIISVLDSTIALEWLEKNKKESKNAVCTLTAGVLAGMFSYIFGEDVDCVEVSCKAKGDNTCEFKVGG
jgi:predicted hydrocarbon binding protein